MLESLNEAKEEIKKLEHLIYVSLKYTRTVDVFLNIIQSMIDTYDMIMESLLAFAKQEDLISEIPSTPREQGDLIKEVFDGDIIKDNISLYFLLRMLSKTNPQREMEYRRNVTMIAYVDNRKEIITIDIITEYYNFLGEFINYVSEMIHNSLDNKV